MGDGCGGPDPVHGGGGVRGVRAAHCGSGAPTWRGRTPPLGRRQRDTSSDMWTQRALGPPSALVLLGWGPTSHQNAAEPPPLPPLLSPDGTRQVRPERRRHSPWAPPPKARRCSLRGRHTTASPSAPPAPIGQGCPIGAWTIGDPSPRSRGQHQGAVAVQAWWQAQQGKGYAALPRVDQLPQTRACSSSIGVLIPQFLVVLP